MKGQKPCVLFVGKQTPPNKKLITYLNRETMFQVERQLPNAIPDMCRQSAKRFTLLLLDMRSTLSRGDSLDELISLITLLKESCQNAELLIINNRLLENINPLMQAGAFRCLHQAVRPDGIAAHMQMAYDAQQLRLEAFEKRLLEQLLNNNKVASEGLDLDVVLDSILQSIRSVGFDRVRLYLAKENGRFFHGRAQVGMRAPYKDAFLQLRIPKASHDYLRTLAAETNPTVYQRPDGEQSIPFDEELDNVGHNEWVYLPLIHDKTVIGLVVADNRYTKEPLVPDALEPLALFAQQAAYAIKNAAYIETIGEQKSQLEKLHEIGLRLSSQQGSHDLLKIIVAEAVKLLSARGGGIYAYDPEEELLTIVADYGRSELMVGQTLKKGEGMAGRLIAEERDYMTVADYGQWPHRAAIYQDARSFGAVIEVLLRWDGRILGVLYIIDEAGRHFTPSEAKLLQLFSAQAAIVMLNSETHDANPQFQKRLAHFSKLGNELISRLSDAKQENTLTLLCQYATDVLQAAGCELFLAREPGVLRLEARHGDYVTRFKKGYKVLVDDSAAGLTAHIARAAHIVRLAEGELAQVLESADYQSVPANAHSLYSVIGMPLMVQHNEQATLLGLLRVDNKLDASGAAYPNLTFSEEDEWLLQLFANVAVVAIESAQYLKKVRGTVASYEHLLAASPTGVVANDHNGDIIFFSPRAQDLLGYSPEEALGLNIIDTIFVNPEDAHSAGRYVREKKGQIPFRRDVDIYHKDGRIISLALSTNLLDVNGSHIGYVGYFEDLGELVRTRERYRMLLDLNNILAQASSLDNGLDQVARKVSQLSNADICAIHLLDETQQLLKPKAVAFADRAHPDADRWRVDVPIVEWQWARVETLLNEESVAQLTPNGRLGPRIMQKWSNFLQLATPIQSALLVPIRLNQEALGLISLSSFTPWHEKEPVIEKTDFLISVANQTANHIALMKTHQTIYKRNQLLQKLEEMTSHVRSIQEPSQVLSEVVRLAVELADCDIGALFVNDFETGKLVLKYSHKMPESLIDQVIERGEGVIGEVFQTGQSLIENKYSERNNQEKILAGMQLQTVAGFPIMRLDEVNGVLMVADREEHHWVLVDERVALEKFARHATAVLHASQLSDNREQLLDQLDIIRRMSELIQERADIEEKLHILMTAVTARYGLRFNRVAIFDYDRERQRLVGRAAIGHRDPADTQRSWERDVAHNEVDFITFRQRLYNNDLPKTPLNQQIKQLAFEVQGPEADLFSQVIHQKQHLVVNKTALAALPPPFIEVFLPAEPTVLVPLKVQNQVIGLLVADNHVHHDPILPTRLKALLNLVDSGAIAIKNGRLLTESEQSRQRLNALYNAGKRLMSIRDPKAVWAHMLKQLHAITNASQVRIILVDKVQGKARELFIAGNEATHTETDIRPDGYSMQVVRTGEPVIIEDAADKTVDANPTFQNRGIAAAVGLPVLLHGTTLGVVWIYFDTKREISPAERDDFQVYVNKSALAYDRAHRIHDLDNLRQSARILAKPVGITETSIDIVQQAVTLFDAHSTALWAYDEGSEKFILDQSVAHNIPSPRWELFLMSEPQPGQNAHTVLNEQYIQIVDIDDPTYAFMSNRTRAHLSSVGIKSMQGVALTIGDEQLGVLYINRNYVGSFEKREEELLRVYAQQAALALKNARLMERANNARRAARVIANKITTHDSTLDDTLDAVIDGVQEAMRCDAVSLFAYLEDQDEFVYPPKLKGVINEKLALRLDHVERGSIVYDVVYADEPLIADDIQSHSAFKDRRFSADEKIVSCVALPLKVGSARVGAMFANYRTSHRFQSEELEDIKLLANQAAIAIYNAQLLDRERLQTRMLQSLNTAAQSVTNSLELDDTLQSILFETYRLFDIQSRELVHASIWLIENDTDIRFVSQPPVTNPQSALFGKKRITNWDQGIEGSKIGVTGRALKSGKVEIVNDVSQHADYIPANLETRSELAVPIKFRNDVVGAINVEGSKIDLFTEQDAEMLQMLAEQTAVAISNARTHESILTLRDIATKLSGDLDLRSVIRQVMQAAVSLTYSDTAWMVFWDGEENQFTHAYRLLDNKNIELYDTTARKDGGWTIQIIQSGQWKIFNHLPRHLDANPTMLRKNRRAVIGVPVKTPDRVTAVLYVCSFRPRHYTTRHAELLESLVSQSGVAIDRVYAYDELQKTKRVIGARTALAWMGMTSSRWRHRIEQHAIGIRNSVFLIKDQWMDQLDSTANRAYLEEKLHDIEHLSDRILSHEITPPLGSNAENIHINELLRERVQQLWQNEPYSRFAEPELQLESTRNKRIKNSTDWLRLAIDNLVDNAIEAMEKAQTAVPRLWISTRTRAGFVELHIRDNGPGMPARVLESLWAPKLEPKIEDGNLGRGLLMVQAIAEAYQGDFHIQTTDSGTTVIIVLKEV